MNRSLKMNQRWMIKAIINVTYDKYFYKQFHSLMWSIWKEKEQQEILRVIGNDISVLLEWGF